MESMVVISMGLLILAIGTIGRHWYRHRDCAGAKRLVFALFILGVVLGIDAIIFYSILGQGRSPVGRVTSTGSQPFPTTTETGR